MGAIMTPKGTHLSGEAKAKISLAERGKPSCNKGRRHSEESRANMASGQRAARPARNEFFHSWIGGLRESRQNWQQES
jgi:hypothetical protein